MLSPLAEPFRRQADALLDLRECALRGAHPGRCVACYFRLLEAAPPRTFDRLCPLCRWLENHIEVVVCDGECRLLESFPLRLADAADLRDYCHAVMAEMRENRVYDSEHINLEFRYRRAA